MRLGIFGGTFDPIHVGHLVLAEQCREQCRLDEVWFVPAAAPPHKLDSAITPGKQRVEILELAVAGMPQFKISDIELKRTGLSFTVDTLGAVKAAHPHDELFLLIGADSLHDFPTWRDPDRIAELATIVAVNRGEPSSVDASTSSALLGETISSRIQFVTMPGIAVSATDLRDRVAAGCSLRFLVPRAVEEYIVQHRLYQQADSEPVSSSFENSVSGSQSSGS
ncbi:MAG: nicotinate-nucleotide adenylyltransferase [Planctomycetota bacterium]|nr:nicotinate-nucleotide adenylyltransferase [Planctomycetota bacterium]